MGTRLNGDAVNQAAAEIGCDGMACDVTNEAQVAALVEATETKHGPVDVFCSNAGAGGSGLLTDADNDVWQQQWELIAAYSIREILIFCNKNCCMAILNRYPNFCED